MPRSQLRERVRDVVPDLVAYTDRILLDEVWERSGISKRDRSLVTISALVALRQPDALADHLALGRANGLGDDEIREAITHLAFYAGCPAAIGAAAVMGGVR